MNKDNIQKSIDIMERAGKFCMTTWQSWSPFLDIRKNEKELHSCGMPACFGGWVAVSHEWKEFGGEVAGYGDPCINLLNGNDILEGSEAIAEWLGIDEEASEGLCYTDDVLGERFYNGVKCYWVTKEMVIKKLKGML